MKRIQCPSCSASITFDETQYQGKSVIVLQCPQCHKKIGIKLKAQAKVPVETPVSEHALGCIEVIENNYCFGQTFDLKMGDNTIGRAMKGNEVMIAIETGDLTMDLTHCVVNVSRNKKGRLQYVLRDGPSYHGTFVNGERLPAREKRNISDGTVFNIGATSIILKSGQTETTQQP